MNKKSSMWPAMHRAEELPRYRSATTRKRATRDGKFHSLEMNAYGKGNRPVRAIVNERTAQEILQKNMCEHGETAISMFGGDAFAFGTRHDKASLVPARKRSLVSPRAMDAFFQDSGGIDGLERRLLNTLFQPHEGSQNGVLVADSEGLLIPHSLYDSRDFRLIAALIFNDPPESSEQNVHSDVAGCDRDPVWNIIFPLKLTQCAKMAATEFRRDGGSDMNERQATMWDACWPHRGLGNRTSDDRVFLHLVIAPYWMVTPDSGSRDFRGLPKDKRQMLRKLAKPSRGMTEDDMQWQFLTELQYGSAEHHGISQEYNNGLPLTAPASKFHEWIDRLR